MIVAFCGHREVAAAQEVRRWLSGVAEQLILEGADIFYLGGYGGFDRMAAGVLGELKERYPHIRRVLVQAYPNRKREAGYDETLYPELEGTPPRLAIARRNRWMAERADVMVAYVAHDWGGAAKTLEYARGKRIFRFPG